MCLSPIKINNPTKRINRYGGQKLRLSVKCNQCAECLNRKRDEYSFRTYWHTKETIKHGGYVLFDTLTYTESYVPHISDVFDIKKYGITDFTCFNLMHYKEFFKRLRSAIEYKYKVKSAITYLFCSEYGENDDYTHRPHYHFLLFVKYKFIDPIWLSQTISDCWQYGRTDGIRYKESMKDFAYHVYGYDLGYGNNTAPYILRAVTHYVSKYILKSSKFQKELNKRIDKIRKQCDDIDIIESSVKHIQMFNRLSQGYGLGYLNNLTEREIEALKTDECLLPDERKVVKTLPLPMYYIRKLYYECVESTTGNKCWQLTERGVLHMAEKRLLQVQKQETNIKDLLHNATEEQRTYFYSLLQDRTISDYCIYMTFYYGRLRSHYSFDLYNQPCYGLTDKEYVDNVEWHNLINDSSFSNTIDIRDVYKVDDDDRVSVRNESCRIVSKYNSFYARKNFYLKKEFIELSTFSSRSCYQFRNFDLVTDFLDKLNKETKRLRQVTYEEKKRLEQTLKQLKQ